MWILRVTIYCFTFVASNFFIFRDGGGSRSSGRRVTFLPPFLLVRVVIISYHSFTILLYVSYFRSGIL